MKGQRGKGNVNNHGEKQWKYWIMRFPLEKEESEARKKLIIGGKWSDPVTMFITPAVLLMALSCS